jgi:hypothetical protein
MMVRGLRSAVCGLTLGGIAWAPLARAAAGDGIYGRTEGDASLVVGVDAGSVGGRKSIGGDLRLRYLETAGVVFGYEELDALKKTESAGEYKRSVRAGIELRPLFPARFLKNHELGADFVDLFVDSFGLDIGAIWSAREGSSVQRPGLYVGLALEVPLAVRATGPWIRIGSQFRWSASKLEGEDDPYGRVFVVTVGLAWHQMFGAHLVDRRDRHVL